MNTTGIIIGVLVVLGIAAAVALYFYKKRNMDNLFNQISINSKQVPKQKKTSFILLMFMESIAKSKKKSTVSMAQMTNPKQLEIQLLRMSQILKDRDNVTDKLTKKALTLLNQYKAWEKLKNGELPKSPKKS